MTLFERFLSSAIKRGTLTVIDYRGGLSTFGTAEAGWPDVTVRFTDAKVPRDIAVQPDLGAGEAYVDGRLVIEQSEVIDLTSLVYRNNPREKGGTIDATSPWRQAFRTAKGKLERIN